MDSTPGSAGLQQPSTRALPASTPLHNSAKISSNEVVRRTVGWLSGLGFRHSVGEAGMVTAGQERHKLLWRCVAGGSRAVIYNSSRREVT